MFIFFSNAGSSASFIAAAAELATYIDVRNSTRGSSILVVADIVMLLPTEVRTDHSFFPLTI